ncbi:MAG: glycosyltransferase family 4 protein [Anaerolineae bacterium]|nr:glycosyltransferase family 4 protein [Caldilineaceae bacterium]MCB0255137.1 glycosyltransferase family 4 protein [Anaerolineae bacterium]
MRVAIDATPMLVAQRTGIERYVTALVRELAAIYPALDDTRLAVYLHAGNPYASKAHLDEAVEVLAAVGLPYRVYGQRRGYGAVLSAFAALDRLDLLHMLPRARPRIQVCPYLLTIYDIKSVGLSKEGQQIERATLSADETRMIREAAGLITISESTTRDLATEFGDALRMPIRAIHLGVDAVYSTGQDHAEAMRQKYGLGQYIFFVGTLQYRKNLPRLIEAFAEVKRDHGIPHKLVLAGRDGWGAELVYQAVREQGVETEVLFPGYIPESDLPGLYAGADVYAYPSLHEGFGIPLLEAMASGTVVYTSNLYSIPEVAGDAAIYVDPYDVASMAAGLMRALCEDALRADLVARGKARAASFSWQRMALETLDFYLSLRSRHNA